MNIKWDSERYAKDFSFVPQYGEAVADLLTVPAGSTVLDVGCGNGNLSAKLAQRGYRVIGLDDSAEMLRLAAKEHPELELRKGSALDFRLETPADAVFSNAVFHWIDGARQQELLCNVAANLRQGGELVAEFGGYGCAEAVHSALRRAFERRGLTYAFEFYFPTVGMYAPMLEKAGFRVEYAVLFDRPTVQKTPDGLADWIRMFDTKPFEGMDEALKTEIIEETKRETEPILYQDGHWIVDYVRIRFRAVKL